MTKKIYNLNRCSESICSNFIAFMIKLQQIRNRWYLPESNKAYLYMSTVNIVMVKDQIASFKIDSKPKIFTLTTQMQHCAGRPRWFHKARKISFLNDTDWKGRFYSETTWWPCLKILLETHHKKSNYNK